MTTWFYISLVTTIIMAVILIISKIIDKKLKQGIIAGAAGLLGAGLVGMVLFGFLLWLFA